MIQVKEALLQKLLPQKISPPSTGDSLPDGESSWERSLRLVSNKV